MTATYTCPACGERSKPYLERATEPVPVVMPTDWTVCMACGLILMVDRSTEGSVKVREAGPEEFMALLLDTRAYGMLLLLQDEIKARRKEGMGLWV